MSFKKGVAKVFRSIANWIENNPTAQGAIACAGCDLVKVAASLLQDAVTKIQTITADAQTKMNQDITSACAKCTQPSPGPSVTGSGGSAGSGPSMPKAPTSSGTQTRK